MMSVLFGGMLAAGILCGCLSGRAEAVVESLLSGAGSAVTLCVSLCGAYMLWMGLMRIAEEAGLVKALGRAMTPLLRRMFPAAPNAIAPITLNLAANFFGLGSAATPFGLAAMRELDAVNPQKGVATHGMCLFLALNASAIELLPTAVLSLRAASGSADVSCVVLPTFAASLVSAAAALLGCFVCARLSRS